jgi:hypothetical protein
MRVLLERVVHLGVGECSLTTTVTTRQVLSIFHILHVNAELAIGATLGHAHVIDGARYASALCSN